MGIHSFIESLVSSSISEEQVINMVTDIIWLRHEHTAESYRRIGDLVGVCYYKYHQKNLSQEQQRDMAKQHALELGLGIVSLSDPTYDIPYTEKPFLPNFFQGWIQGYQMMQMNP